LLVSPWDLVISLIRGPRNLLTSQNLFSQIPVRRLEKTLPCVTHAFPPRTEPDRETTDAIVSHYPGPVTPPEYSTLLIHEEGNRRNHEPFRRRPRQPSFARQDRQAPGAGHWLLHPPSAGERTDPSPNLSRRSIPAPACKFYIFTSNLSPQSSSRWGTSPAARAPSWRA